MEIEIPITVQQKHCDELGHLNHVEAVRYLETARDDWYVRCGLWEENPGRRLGTVVVNVNYDYRLECFLGERLAVITQPLRMGRKSFTFAHQIRKPDGGVAIEGTATSVVMDLDARVTLPVPACMAERFPR